MEPTLQQQITGYWTRRSGDFAAQRRRELAGEKHAQWLAELNRYIPAGGGWNILDLGTGSGFYALLLAAQGHTVTGIDLTPAMIDRGPPHRRRAGQHRPLCGDGRCLPGLCPRAALTRWSPAT